MKISIIIPAYNEEAYLGACLDHVVAAAEGTDCEILVVDNNSKDRTVEIAKGYPNIKVFLETRKGPTWARQCGYEHSTGDLIAMVDADTRMPRGWIKMALKVFREDKRVVFLSGPYEYYDFPWPLRAGNWFYWHILAYPFYFFLRHMAIAGNMVLRRDVLEKMGGLDTTIEFYGDDTNASRRAAQFGRAVFKLEFIMVTSGRRLFQQGFVNTIYHYALNFFSQALFGKTLDSEKHYQDFR